MRRERRWKLIALLAGGMAIGVTMAATPVGAHVANWTHNWNTHIRPRADARYGAAVHANSEGDGNWVTGGTWAVTAP